MVENIIYYDGECGLCHAAVKFILRIDTKNKFHFSPISKLIQNEIKIDSVILKINDKVYYEGQAIVTIMENIENNWSYVASILRIIPIDRLNQLYRWISKNRKKVFSKKQYACPNIPTHLKNRFILK